ncbi:Ferric-chelate reductase [Rasamsonia emersonii CBS 393.64]|uniref:Ferric-chelate reductase n=1 Tax=Rasamsonia emersonii (strain ATCC 16479 / CBS 393.64 / IMI 116815) TaxID=1408163 RepID=A0A0F4YVY3_RASE3|nr:Ferric-chelate reductase [Rasamsonia emersonii CBS 393.64]KKA22462.1 Ferric-chelate reductase [Rasamsonia emersonii CBS 393.64]
MRLLALFPLVLTLGVSFTRADEVSDEERCVEAIFEAYTHLSFTGSHSQPFLVDSCLNPLRTWSIYASVKVFCAPSEIHPGLRHINKPCQGELSRTPYADIAPALTEDYIRSLRVVDYAEVPKAVELDTPVLISRAYYEASFRTNNEPHHSCGDWVLSSEALLLLFNPDANGGNTDNIVLPAQLCIHGFELRYLRRKSLDWHAGIRKSLSAVAVRRAQQSLPLGYRVEVFNFQSVPQSNRKSCDYPGYRSLYRVYGSGYEKTTLIWSQATVCMSLLLLFSSIYLRRNFYELFLLIHITFSVVVIVGLFIHTAIFSGRYDIYLWPVVVVWSLDRLARIVRLVYCNIHIYINRKRLCLTRGRLSYNRLSDILWLEVTIPGDKLEPKPGQHYYVYQPLRWKGYENHPFTLGSWTVAGSDSDSNDALPLPSGTRPTTDRKLIFWIRPFDGWTRRLRNECLRAPGLTVDSTFLLEGPYGQVSPLYNYETVILIAGGSGIAGVLPYIEDHFRRCRNSCGDFSDDSGATTSSPATKPGSRNTRTRDVTLIWTARQREFIEEIGRYGFQSTTQRQDFHVRLYATSRGNKRLPLQGSVTKNGPPSSPTEHTSLVRNVDYSDDDPCLDIAFGRPDIKGLISDHVRATGLPGPNNGVRTAVLVCGPGAMADDARLAVHRMLKEGYRVEYFEEAFGW